jgi:hypothetical protein
LDPHLIVAWIRIRIPNADPEYHERAKKKAKCSQKTYTGNYTYKKCTVPYGKQCSWDENMQCNIFPSLALGYAVPGKIYISYTTSDKIVFIICKQSLKNGEK